MNVQCYLVLSRHRGNGRVSASRVTRHRPPLAANQAMIRLDILVPDDVFDAPLLTVPVERGNVAVVEAVEPLCEQTGERFGKCAGLAARDRATELDP